MRGKWYNVNKVVSQQSVTSKRTFFKMIFLCFMLPISIMLICNFFAFIKYKDVLENNLKNNYVSNLSTLAETVDGTFNELQNTILLVSSNEDLYDIFYSNEEITGLDAYKINTIIDTLLKFRSTKDIIENVYIYHKASNKVITVLGTYDAEDFFERIYEYEGYGFQYWNDLKIKTTFYEILPTTTLRNNAYSVEQIQNVIPFVTSNIDTFKSPNLLVININEAKLSNLLEKYKFETNSNLFVMNSAGHVISSTNETLGTSLETQWTDLENQLKEKDIVEIDFNGEKTIAITYSPTYAKFSDFTYVALVPYSEFAKNLSTIRFVVMFSMIFGLGLSVILAYLMSKKIYSPIDNLVNVLRGTNSSDNFNNDSEIKYINNQISEILVTEQNLKENLSKAQILANEQYFIKMLTNNEVLLEEETKNFLENNGIEFENKKFCIAIIEVTTINGFYRDFKDINEVAIKKGIVNIFTSSAFEGQTSNVINIDKNRTCILLNLSDEISIEEISEKINEVLILFNEDKDKMLIKVGVSDLFSDYIKISQYYVEALRALISIAPLGDNCLKVYGKTQQQRESKNYRYAIGDENKLFNYLMGCYKEEAIEFIDELINKVYQNSPSEKEVKKFYLNIYNTVTRVLNEKGLKAEDLMGHNYIDVQADVSFITVNNIHKYMVDLINKMLAIKSGGKIDITEITEYIRENYTEDLYLEGLADKYNTTDKYLSKLFKNSLGIGFQEYLATIRLVEAKKLLLETDISIVKIGEKVGFSNHSTFFRVFKKFEGVSPKQFRDTKVIN